MNGMVKPFSRYSRKEHIKNSDAWRNLAVYRLFIIDCKEHVKNTR
jgi:hypothetical protein